jgi:hypothetical protein
MKPKTPAIKKAKPRTALARAYAKGICAPETSEAIYDVIDSDDFAASAVKKTPTKPKSTVRA